MMGLLQKAVETFDAHSHLVGVERDNCQTLAPISHILVQADLEITLEPEGSFSSARLVSNESKIPIPVTEDSAGRTSGPCAHPLCDQLCYLAPYDEKKHRLYINQLTEWVNSSYSHPMLQPILTYVQNGTILDALTECGLIKLDANGIPQKGKMMVRWRVHGIGTPKDGCWQQPSLVKSFQDWYISRLTQRTQTLCMVSGTVVIPAAQHLKGVIPSSGNAKLISSNDTSNFTFRGRFTDARQAVTVGYIVSQKAHNALQWLVAEQGVRTRLGGRTFLCWNPQGIRVCHATAGFGHRDEVKTTLSDYRQELKNTLDGMCSQLPNQSGVVIAALDSATIKLLL